MVCFKCRSLCVSSCKGSWGKSRNGTAGTREGSGHMWRKLSFPGMCSARWALSSLLCWQSLSLWSDNPGFLLVAKEQSSKWAGMGPSPRLQRGHKILKVLVLTGKKKKRYILEMVVLSIHCKQEWDFIVWLQLKCYFVRILYSLKKLVCNNKATLCLLWGGRELRQNG